MKASSEQITLGSIRMTAMNILAMREHSQYELKAKLKDKFNRKLVACEDLITLEELNEFIDLTLEQLVADKLLDDHRYTESFIHSRMIKGQGPVKIRYELKQRGITENLIDECLDESPDVWQDVIERVRIKRFGEPYPEDLKEQTRQSRFLYQRGFDSGLIRKLFNSHH
jgi:regulatory protein